MRRLIQRLRCPHPLLFAPEFRTVRYTSGTVHVLMQTTCTCCGRRKDITLGSPSPKNRLEVATVKMATLGYEPTSADPRYWKDTA